MSLFLSLLLLILSIPIATYLYLTWNFGYWRKRDVKEVKSKVLVGSYPNYINQKKNIIYDMEEIYKKYKNDENFVGVFMVREPQLLILEPKLVHEIFVTKFDYFRENGPALWIEKDVEDILGKNPFFLTGDEWKEKRSEMTAALTSARIKVYYTVMQQTSEKMSNYIKKLLVTSPKECNIDGKNLANRFTCQVICDCVYGIDARCFTEENTQIHIEIRKLIDGFINNFMLKLVSSIIPFVRFIMKPRFISESTEKYFIQFLQNAIEVRQNKKSDRIDVLNYLLHLKNKKNLTKRDLVAHTITFMADGYETSASTISHCLLCLARNKSAQERLREEILHNLDDNGTINFENLSKMEYLDQCIQETLRIFIPVALLSKVCTKPVELENTRGRSLKLKVGEVAVIPLHLYQHDEKYFPNPEEYIPERFNEENGGVRIYREEGKFLPFGDGPRMCLGYKFGLTQTKAAVCEIIKNFEITPNVRTRKDNYINAQNLVTILEGGIWLNFKEIKN